MCRGEFLLAWYEPGMSKDMKWVKRHRAMLDSLPESGGGPGSGGGRAADTVGGYNSSGTHCDVTCPMKIDLPLASRLYPSKAAPIEFSSCSTLLWLDFLTLCFAHAQYKVASRPSLTIMKFCIVFCKMHIFDIYNLFCFQTKSLIIEGSLIPFWGQIGRVRNIFNEKRIWK